MSSVLVHTCIGFLKVQHTIKHSPSVNKRIDSGPVNELLTAPRVCCLQPTASQRLLSLGQVDEHGRKPGTQRRSSMIGRGCEGTIDQLSVCDVRFGKPYTDLTTRFAEVRFKPTPPHFILHTHISELTHDREPWRQTYLIRITLGPPGCLNLASTASRAPRSIDPSYLKF